MAVRIFYFRYVCRRPQQGQLPPPLTTSPPPQPRPEDSPDPDPHASRSSPQYDVEAGGRPSSDPRSAVRSPQATQSSVEGVTRGRGSDPDNIAEPFFLQLEVVTIPGEGWEASLRVGSGPAWLWWSVVVVVVALLLMYAGLPLWTAVVRARHG
ncbi:uncharacterized protein NECHADRAFT_85560 [Fusarium vanettenii 77-13-4]|uniref:Uncharacterized protein n=1 Tax=Fusarium vanettenii (strain ATCC MYA-4622 / CBS 123669 / FGSC 9596 / NRRL 45880 / 77-13-4) TaxID=660122 RepID=C7ZNW0_FUSV7|nr:uncharacterized protein NECHADRAFT_85560 [Fusarium vanettenii 77-13-4]EEU34071.1 predicted protein [Fusarium vanettenii 77-13-4]